MHSPKLIRSPKRIKVVNDNSPSWYDYYAGYSEDFVRDAINRLALPSKSVIVDPWNGSGTTTRVAADMGMSAFGYDVNPVMIVVATARALDAGVRLSIGGLSRTIRDTALALTDSEPIDNDPLQAWLTEESTLALRNLERGIQRHMMSREDYKFLYVDGVLEEISTLAAFFYTALFRTILTILSPFRSSNPTWIRVPKEEETRVEVTVNKLHQLFDAYALDMAAALKKHNTSVGSEEYIEAQIAVASSESIPRVDNSVDATISSPPYCTRIDYVVATRPELSVLGLGLDHSLPALRSKMIGTPTIREKTPESNTQWGETCNNLLNAVTDHAAKASKSYYLKTYLQYFDSVHRSLGDLHRTLRDEAKCVLVVQDSYYKELHVDLPQIFREMGDRMGWDLLHRADFRAPKSIAQINTGARRYRPSHKATESALFFQVHKSTSPEAK